MPERLGARAERQAIVLPLCVNIDRATVRRQFGVSRTTMKKWRDCLNFPAANEAGEIESAAIFAWARQHQIQIEWV